ncbi:alpha/beta hydrolase [Mycobacterium sp. CVI_P3]|uniref:Alpha/beta hydrolase n=1 Tax=Mycobacterium pinniadriaticum TaxID=2994102 RepID=A0ABT3SHC3_9MYCO|nr:alpha/beta hydrolase [Mycobacterium pinniadriaticum]MCX2932440.1 alpha/beta hydrolase [Mycobacterium pinniadriaticum]MCX2938926.1 alpha/beta hydrolase [Mycobacterium pinniadriaticum]
MAGVAGLGAVSTVAGLSAARSLRYRSFIEDAYRGEDFALLDADRGCVVTTPDGTPLVVREVGPITAPLTVVFAHGFCLRMGSFHFQRAALADRWGGQVRMVFYDQRGHGQSSAAPVDTYTVTQLGQDLETILQVMVPRGPIVLVGHSMGGMTVLSHARQFPEHYGSRVVGAALISSAAEGLPRSPVGEILQNPALEAVRFAARYVPKMIHRTRGAARSVLRPILRTASYGDDKTSPSVAAFSEEMIHDTPIATLVEFLHALEVHDESAALPVLARIPTLIACGDHDVLTPVVHSEEMAAVLPNSELLIVAGAGHLVQLEQPEVINDALVRLVERATPSKLVAFARALKDRARG